MSKEQEECWVFSFCLESETGRPVLRAEANQLMEDIIQWAEDRNLQIGGGYHRPRPEELEPGPIFDVDDDDVSEP